MLNALLGLPKAAKKGQKLRKELMIRFQVKSEIRDRVNRFQSIQAIDTEDAPKVDRRQTALPCIATKVRKSAICVRVFVG